MMTSKRSAYLPLTTYPDATPDAPVLAALRFASVLGCNVEVMPFTVDIPHITSPLGSILLDIPGLVHSAEEKSRNAAKHLTALIESNVPNKQSVKVTEQLVTLGAVMDRASVEARYFDLVLVPWSGETFSEKELAQAMVFGSGRPAIIVPAFAEVANLDHIAIAWDASRVAARALGDALPLLAHGGRVTVLTVQDDKPLDHAGLAASLASALEQRGLNAVPLSIELEGRTIAIALQEAAIAAGVGLLAMGGYGHSRVRDFILGGATKGILSDLHLPALLSH